jgi:hypothetical protein
MPEYLATCFGKVVAVNGKRVPATRIDLNAWWHDRSSGSSSR